jgi:hypothetical protein
LGLAGLVVPRVRVRVRVRDRVRVWERLRVGVSRARRTARR